MAMVSLLMAFLAVFGGIVLGGIDFYFLFLIMIFLNSVKLTLFTLIRIIFSYFSKKLYFI